MSMTLKTTKNMCCGLSVVLKITTRRSTIDVRKKSDLSRKIGPLVHPDMSGKYETGPNLVTQAGFNGRLLAARFLGHFNLVIDIASWLHQPYLRPVCRRPFMPTDSFYCAGRVRGCQQSPDCAGRLRRWSAVSYSSLSITQVKICSTLYLHFVIILFHKSQWL